MTSTVCIAHGKNIQEIDSGSAISVVMYGLYGPDSGLGNAANAGVDSGTME